MNNLDKEKRNRRFVVPDDFDHHFKWDVTETFSYTEDEGDIDMPLTGDLISVTKGIFHEFIDSVKVIPRRMTTINFISENGTADLYSIVESDEDNHSFEDAFNILNNSIISAEGEGLSLDFILNYFGDYYGEYYPLFGRVFNSLHKPHRNTPVVRKGIEYPPVYLTGGVKSSELVKLILGEKKINVSNLSPTMYGQRVELNNIPDELIEKIISHARKIYIDNYSDLIISGQVKPTSPWSSDILKGEIVPGWEIGDNSRLTYPDYW